MCHMFGDQEITVQSALLVLPTSIGFRCMSLLSAHLSFSKAMKLLFDMHSHLFQLK
jgi:hypothetical protein